MNKKRWAVLIVLLFLTGVAYATTTITKGLIGRQDINWWTGTSTKTFTRSSSEGYSLTLLKVGYEVDALMSYGGGVNYTRATIASALTGIGTTNKVTVVLNPGTWTITTDLNCTSYSNVYFYLPAGAMFSITATKTLTLPSPNNIIASPGQQIFTGTGTVTFAASGGAVYPEWWGIDGTADEVQINKAIVAAANVKCVKLQGTTYTLAAGITNSTSDMAIICDTNQAILTTAADIDGITLSEKTQLKNIKIVSTNGSSTKAGLKLTDGAKASRFYNVWSSAFAYGTELYSASTTGVAYNDYYGFRTTGITSACIYIHTSGDGWVNENHWFGGSQSASTAGRLVNIASDCNQNVFMGTSFEGGNADLFDLVDHGSNSWMGCRFEFNGHAFYVHNDSNNQRSMTHVSDCYWSLEADKMMATVVEGRLKTDAYFFNAASDGYVVEGAVTDTTVDQNSASGAATLYIASTTGLFEGSPIVIDEGGADEEWHIVKTVTAGVSVILWGNLANTHTAVDAHEVKSHGRFYGQVCFPWEGWQYVHHFAYGEQLFVLDANTNNINVIGNIHVDGTKVVDAQQTGVSAMTNVTTPANLDADTVTTAELADIVGNLIVKLRAHGLVAN